MGENISELVVNEIKVMGVSFTPDYIVSTQKNTTNNVTFTYDSETQVWMTSMWNNQDAYTCNRFNLK